MTQTLAERVNSPNPGDSWTSDQFLEFASQQTIISVDTESTGLLVKDGRDYGTGISIGFRIGPYIASKYFPLRHPNTVHGNNLPPEYVDKIGKVILRAPQLIFHNAKHDIPTLVTFGIRIPYPKEQVIWDTMLMAHILDENRPFQGKSLENCVLFYLKKKGKKDSDEFRAFIKAYGWGQVPPALMAEYGAGDAEITFELWEHLHALMVDEGVIDYWIQQKQKTNYIYYVMESHGVVIDQELCKRQESLGQIQMDEVLELLGYDNLGPKALKELLLEKLQLPPQYKKRKGGKETLTFDKDAMKIYEEYLSRSDDPTAQYILTYRGWQKAVSSNYKPYQELVSPDGRLRPNYKLHGTRTGRSSCELPNLQQIPKTSDKPWNGKMKQAFIAAPGYGLWEADYAQLELRLGTAYGQVEKLKQVFAEGRDIFTEMSLDLGMSRFDTKTLTYTLQYGGGINRLVVVFGVSPDKAASIRANYFNTYPGFKVVADLAQRKVLSEGRLQLWSRRYRHFLNRTEEAHKGFNSVIQGGSADIVERTMIRLFENVYHPEECRMLLQVHDSIVFEIKEGLEEKYHPLIKQYMENVEPDFGVKFKVDLHKWGE